MGLRNRLLHALAGSGAEDVREGDVAEAAVVPLAQSALIVSGLEAQGIAATAVEEHVMEIQIGRPEARIMVRSEQLAEARRLIEELRV
jgi:Putative prokaryotic signal transducing protein